MKALRFIVAASLVINFITSTTPVHLRVGNAAEILNQSAARADSETTLRRLYLARRNDYLRTCRPYSDREVFVFSRVGTHKASIKVGDPFYVIEPNQSSVRGRVTGMVKDCHGERESISDNINFTVVRLEKPIVLKEFEDDARVAVMGGKLQRGQLGTIKPIRDREEQQLYRKLLRRHMPAHQTIIPADPSEPTIFSITLPSAKAEYIFATVDYDDPKVEGKAPYSIGFLFVKQNGEPKLLMKEPQWRRIFSVTDLDDNGVSEMGVVLTSFCCATYEARLFDGRKFIAKPQPLYHWAH